MEQFEFDLGVPVVEQPALPGKDEPNPMCRNVGYGPVDAQCKMCKYLVQKVVHSQAKFYKCTQQMRKNKYTGSGEGKDYRLKWKACKLYKEKGVDEQ